MTDVRVVIIASVTKDTPKNDGEHVQQNCHNVKHKLNQIKSEWNQRLQQFEQIKDDDDHSDHEANGKHNDAANHPSRTIGPFTEYKVISGSSEDNTSYKGFCSAETPSQAAQVAVWTFHSLHDGINQEGAGGNQRGDETQYADNAGEADKQNCKDDGGRGDHHCTQGSQSAAQVCPVREEGSQEDVPLPVLHHGQNHRHNDAEKPDELTPDTPRTHHPASEHDDDERQSAEDYFQEAQDALKATEWATHDAQNEAKKSKK